MANVQYPSGSLPKPLVEGFGGGENNAGLLRSSMDSGYIRQLNLIDDTWQSITFSWEFTQYEFTVFASWVRHKLDRGSEWFDIEVPYNDIDSTLTVRLQSGKFQQSALPGGNYKVTATLDLQDAKPIDEDALDFLLDYSEEEFASLESAIDRLHIYVTTVFNNDLRDSA